MLIIYSGKWIEDVRNRARARVHTLVSPEAPFVHLAPEHYVSGMIREYSESTSLFLEHEVVLLDSPHEDEMYNEEFCTFWDELQESKNIFVVIYKELTALEKKKLPAGAEVVACTFEPKSSYNTFALTDALLARDKKNLWLLLMEARREGVSSEEIAGVLFWQLKVMRLTFMTKTAEEAGQKPFVYGKAKRMHATFSAQELSTLSHNLLLVYHKAHRGLADLDSGLEQWVLHI